MLDMILTDDFYPTYLLTSFILVSLLLVLWASKKEVDVPAVGPSGSLSSFIGAARFLFRSKDMLLNGYREFSVFKIPEFAKWNIMVCQPKLIEELRLAADGDLSFQEAVNQSLAVTYTLGQEIHTNPYHISVLRGPLTRNMTTIYPEIRDEIVSAFGDNVVLPNGEWHDFNPLDLVMKVISRVSNRLFVGLPLCRNQDWLKLTSSFSVEVVMCAVILNTLPEFMKPLVAWFIVSLPRATRRGVKHLRPIVETRQAMQSSERPNDFMTWLMDATPSDEIRNIEKLTHRILTLNVASIHTSSMAFAMALLYLAAEPEKYLLPMREEIERVVALDGWSKTSLTKMRLVDSFLRESLRLSGILHVAVSRKAMRDYTFSNGLSVPKGATVSVPTVGVHTDEKLYDQPLAFDGFRFARLRQEDGEGAQYAFVATSTSYLPFGHGRHACPGRFFAGNELKTMLAHIVTDYDIKLPVEGVRPPDESFGAFVMPNSKARILLRKRNE